MKRLDVNSFWNLGILGPQKYVLNDYVLLKKYVQWTSNDFHLLTALICRGYIFYHYGGYFPKGRYQQSAYD